MTDESYQETTRGVRITVQPSFLDEQSAPGESRYFWLYHVTIENIGTETVQLLLRHWRITDALGRMREVRGPGVVGEQPIIEPGQSHEYSSGVPLETPSGFMSGSYKMRATSGELFDAAIPMFALESPYEKRQVH